MSDTDHRAVIGARAIARFEASYVPEPNTGCWLWLGGHTPAGYGQIWYSGRQGYAHRFAYELFRGPIPSGYDIDHLCRQRACVNPAHLEPVTHLVNVRRGLVGQGCTRGESSATSKLTAAQVQTIRQDSRSNEAVARVFGVSSAAIQKIRSGKGWQWLSGSDGRPWNWNRPQRTKLTSVQAAAIRADRRTGKEIARAYGVSRALVSLIKNGKVWR